MSPRREVELRIAAHAQMCEVHNSRVHGRFYGLDLKKEMVVLENNPKEVARLNDSRFKSKGKNTGYNHDLHGQ